MQTIRIKLLSVIICSLLFIGIFASQDKTSQKDVDLMITNAQILTMDNDKNVYENGVLGYKDILI